MKRILSILLFSAMACLGQTTYWLDGNGDFTNATKWSSGQPRYDSEMGWIDGYFTNKANFLVTGTSDVTYSNLFFDFEGVNITLTNCLDGITHNVRGDYKLGGVSSTSTSWVQHISGTIVITNDTGTGKLVVGETGFGQYDLKGGTLIVDNLIATNAVLAQSNLTFILSAGTLTTKQSVIWTNSLGKIRIGASTSSGATWNVYGSVDIRPIVYGHTIVSGTNTTVNSYGANFGTNGMVMQALGGSFNLYSNSRFFTANTLGFEVGSGAAGNNSTFLNDASFTSNLAALAVGNSSSYGSFITRNGGTNYFAALGNIGQTAGSGNLILLTDSGTYSRFGNLTVGAGGSGANFLTVSNGAYMEATGTLTIGATATNTAVVDGANTLCGASAIAFSGNRNTFRVANGATFTNTSASMQGFGHLYHVESNCLVRTSSHQNFPLGSVAASNNTTLVEGVWINTGGANAGWRLGLSARSNALIVTGPMAVISNFNLGVGQHAYSTAPSRNKFSLLDRATMKGGYVAVGWLSNYCDNCEAWITGGSLATNLTQIVVSEKGPEGKCFILQPDTRVSTANLTTGSHSDGTNSLLMIGQQASVNLLTNLWFGYASQGNTGYLYDRASLNAGGNIVCGTGGGGGELNIGGATMIATNANFGALNISNSVVRIGGAATVMVKEVSIR